VIFILVQQVEGQGGSKRRATSAAQPVEKQKTGPADFDAIAGQATSAREADKVEEAIGLYRQALTLKPGWVEGWWFLGTLYYDVNKFGEAAPAFKQVAQIQVKAGAPWVMLGLCEFQLERYDDAFNHIRQGRELGIVDNPELERVMRYHEGLLYLVKGDFERAQQKLGTLSYQGLSTEDLIIALGLSVLRMGMLPKQVDINYRDREVVRRAGLAEHFNAQRNVSDATREYELLAKDFSTFPNVQYAYGRFLLSSRDNDGALAAFQREIQNSPKHSLARMQIAYIKLLDKEPTEGLVYAEEAAKLNARLPLVHYILGRLLFDSGQNVRAIQELELAGDLRPDEPKVYFALARAYAKANRKEDAAKARDTFTRLNQKASEAEARGDVRGETLPNDNPAPDKP
jgi:Flp pilus assembly protein TadD